MLLYFDFIWFNPIKSIIDSLDHFTVDVFLLRDHMLFCFYKVPRQCGIYTSVCTFCDFPSKNGNKKKNLSTNSLVR